MTPRSHQPASFAPQSRIDLANRLRARRSELEQTILARVCAIADPSEAPDPEYLPGLRRAVSAAVDHGFHNIEDGEQTRRPIPVALLGQARLAARNEVRLSTVLQRCVSGYTILMHFLEEEAMRNGQMRSGVLGDLRTSQLCFLDRLLSGMGEEHDRGIRDCPRSSPAVLADRVQQLLAGELVDTSEIAYDFNSFHIGVVTKGAAATDVLRCIAKALDGRLLHIYSDNIIWAWLGTQNKVDRCSLRQLANAAGPLATPLALGESGVGCMGWRLTHRQARAAFSVALQCECKVVQYADVALLASMAQDELLATSLRDIYLDPLTTGRDGGDTLRETLRAYFSSGRNSSSTAAALSVSRQTVANRLRVVETRLGQTLASCDSGVEAALKLADFELPAAP